MFVFMKLLVNIDFRSVSYNYKSNTNSILSVDLWFEYSNHELLIEKTFLLYSQSYDWDSDIFIKFEFKRTDEAYSCKSVILVLLAKIFMLVELVIFVALAVLVLLVKYGIMCMLYFHICLQHEDDRITRNSRFINIRVI